MGKELDLLLPLMENCTTREINGVTLHEGVMGTHKVTAMQCGIGKVNAAMGAMTLIEAAKPQLVVNSGVAGGTGNGARILDVVVGDRVAYHDVWCGPCSARGCIQGMPQFFKAPEELISSTVFDREGVVRGLIASGDQFVDNADELARIRGLYPEVKAVDMESAAIAHVCHVKGVRFISIRVVSDTPGEADNTSQYESFWDDAPQHTFEVLKGLIESL